MDHVRAHPTLSHVFADAVRGALGPAEHGRLTCALLEDVCEGVALPLDGDVVHLMGDVAVTTCRGEPSTRTGSRVRWQAADDGIRQRRGKEQRLGTDDEPRAHARFNVFEYRQHLIDAARQRLRALIAEESHWTAIQDVVVLGLAYREILRIADDVQPDLIVMGAQGRGGIGLALFGSTTHQIVRAAPCPVLTVRGGNRGRVP